MSDDATSDNEVGDAANGDGLPGGSTPPGPPSPTEAVGETMPLAQTPATPPAGQTPGTPQTGQTPTVEVPAAADATPPSTGPAAPASLYDVPWQPADEPVPAWVDTGGGGATSSLPPLGDRHAQADPTAVPPSTAAYQSQPTAATPYAAPTAAAPPVGGSYPASAAHPYASAQRPRRAGIIAASVVAIAVVLVGVGVIALVAVGQATGSDDADGGGSVATVGTSVPTDTAPVPSAPPVIVTTAPPIVAPPTTLPPVVPTTPPTEPPTNTPNTVPGDLGLTEPMRRPACDGQFIVIVANAVTPGVYERQVAEAQQRFVGSAYLKTDQTCSSLRPVDDLGNAIYSIYYGPFPTLGDACRIRDQVGGDSYVKILDQVTPNSEIWDC